MPYKNNASLPESVRQALPSQAQTIYRKAFNSAFDGTCNEDDDQEGCAAAIAWSAVEKTFKKDGDSWVKKNMSEARQLITHFDWQFSGAFPEVPINKNVDYDQLIQGDDNPMFITLPFAIDKGVADDKMQYSEAFNSKLLDQMQNEPITGHMGHIPAGERSSSYPTPVVFWVGATKDATGKYWAKGYISDPQVRELVRQYKAVGSQIATSIYATYDPMSISWHKDGTWEIDPSTLNLEHLDFAPPKRAALEIPGRKFALSDHMKDENGDEEMELTKEQVIAQLTAADVPAAVKDEILASAKTDEAVVSQLTEANNVISQLRTALTEVAGELMNLRIDAKINEVVKVESPALVDYVKSKLASHLKPGEVTPAEEVDKALAEITETETYKGLATAVVMQLSGGKVPGQANQNDVPTKSRGELAEENIDEILANLGISV